MLFHLLLFHLLFWPSALASTDSLPDCPTKCGNITIPYPFGIQTGCHLAGFLITCNTTYNPPQAFISTTDIQVSNISLDALTVLSPVARNCYAPLNLTNHDSTQIDFSSFPYTFSSTRNRFTALGCDTVALVYQNSILDYTTGCVSFCNDPSAIANGTCSGIGCCQTAIPSGLQRIDTILRPLQNHTNTWNFSPCSYAFLIDMDQFVFNLTDLYTFYRRREVPVVLDWAIGSDTCEDAAAFGGYACGENSYCSNSTNGQGYRCSCNIGYQGNPYLSHGCQDINECNNPASNPCVKICQNTPGSYVCSCPHGFYGDGKLTGNGCLKQSKKFPVVQVPLGIGLGFLILLFTGAWLSWGLRKRRRIHLKERFFKQNGGLLLQQQIASHDGTVNTAARIFTAEELQHATDNYSENRILGRGGHGIVYKGILPDSRVIAIKKSRLVDETQIEQFINEVIILSQVIHKNVVKIIGCCLETEVPLLVYEYVSNGTLDDHIHVTSSLSWETRLRIASETAEALAYLHSATARAIFHRDVKSANILLDSRFMAKVSDFGISCLIPLDRTQITTLVQGTLGYLDPEYFQTGKLTEKSDVYSFGVVLAELLTGQKPISQARPQEEQNLAMYFLMHLREARLFEILEPQVRNEGSREQLQVVAELTKRCLRLRGEDRPTMTEVAGELERSRRQIVHPWIEDDGNVENASLLDESATMYYTGRITGDESFYAHSFLPLEIHR